MKKKWLLLVALLALGLSAAAEDASPAPPSPRKLELDDSAVGDLESINEKMELFDELDTPDNDLELSKSEIDYFVNKNIDDSRPEPPALIVQTPLFTTVEEGDAYGHQPQEPRPVVVPPQVSEIEETHEYLVQHDLVLDLHHQHLSAAYRQLQNLEAQFIALADDLDSGTSKLQVDANTKDLLINFAAHLVYIQDEQVYEHDNPAPALYDWHVHRLIDFEAITLQAEAQQTELNSTNSQKVQELSFGTAMNQSLLISQALHQGDSQGPNSATWKAAQEALGIKTTQSGESTAPDSKNLQWHIKSDFVQEAKPWIRRIKARKNMAIRKRGSSVRFRRHSHNSRQMRVTKQRHAMVVETDTGFQYPFQHDRNPWAKTRFQGYVRPVLQDSFELESLAATNSTLDDILLYYNSSFSMLEPTPQHESLDALIDPDDDVHAYYRIKGFSEVGYFVLEQIWNDLNQINTDFHTLPNTHLNSLAFLGLRPLHDKIRCGLGNNPKKLQSFDESIQKTHQEFREHVALVVASIEACEDDVFAILSLIEFYRNYKGSTVAGVPEFMELVDRSKADVAELKTLQNQAEDRVLQLQEELGRFEEKKQGFLAALASFEGQGGSWVVRGAVGVVLLLLTWV